MSPSFFDKFKENTKQAADQMGKATKIAKFKLDIMTLTGERSRHCQIIGEKTFEIHADTGSIDGTVLRERIRDEFTQIERIDGRIRDLENQIADLKAMIQHGTMSDVADATAVTDITDKQEPGEPK